MRRLDITIQPRIEIANTSSIHGLLGQHYKKAPTTTQKIYRDDYDPCIVLLPPSSPPSTPPSPPSSPPRPPSPPSPHRLVSVAMVTMDRWWVKMEVMKEEAEAKFNSSIK